jgi:broad specificity phosphatase PhoE
MRVVDHFRHSIRTRPGKHLSREGVLLARRVGATLGNYDLVVTSKLPRAIETAIAMGYASDRRIKELASMFGAEEEVDWSAGCAALAAALQTSKQVSHVAHRQAEIMRSISAYLPDKGRALVVSHGGVVELGVVGLLPDEDFSSWGPSCDRCEGVRLHFDGATCVGAELLRMAQQVPTP